MTMPFGFPPEVRPWAGRDFIGRPEVEAKSTAIV